jgi:hypothetical protein
MLAIRQLKALLFDDIIRAPFECAGTGMKKSPPFVHSFLIGASNSIEP